MWVVATEGGAAELSAGQQGRRGSYVGTLDRPSPDITNSAP